MPAALTYHRRTGNKASVDDLSPDERDARRAAYMARSQCPRGRKKNNRARKTAQQLRNERQKKTHAQLIDEAIARAKGER